MEEVEESNDEARLRKTRIEHGIRKMRLERAYLLEMLGKRMKKNGAAVDGVPEFFNEDSEGSSEGPPTPNDRPLRHKRSHRRPLNSSPPAMDYQISQQQQSVPQGRYDQQAQQQHESSYGPSNHGNTDDGSAPPAAYLPNQSISAMPQPPILPSNNVATSIPQQQPNPLLSPIPAPEPFMMFFENNYLSQPHKHTGARTEDDLLKLAKKNWEDADFVKQRRMYENQAEKQRQMYEDAQANIDYEMASKQQGATRQAQGQGRVIQPKAEDGEARPGSSKGRPREEEGAAVHDVEMTGTPPAGGYGGFTSINR